MRAVVLAALVLSLFVAGGCAQSNIPFVSPIRGDDPAEAHVQQIPDSAALPHGQPPPEVKPPAKTTSTASAAAASTTASTSSATTTRKIDCSGANATNPECYTATQQGRRR
jgi:hypothetical protein